eukprot:6099109-Alexandrium_andersonii.AAC.1
MITSAPHIPLQELLPQPTSNSDDAGPSVFEHDTFGGALLAVTDSVGHARSVALPEGLSESATSQYQYQHSAFFAGLMH